MSYICVRYLLHIQNLVEINTHLHTRAPIRQTRASKVTKQEPQKEQPTEIIN
jgi:hypothetical protein